MNSWSELIRRVEANPPEYRVLATLVRTEGSSYRRPGARLLVTDRGDCYGVMSGGCLETEIARRGLALMHSSRSAELHSFDMRLLYGCDGKLEILLERLQATPVAENLFIQVGRELQQRRSCQIQTRYGGGDDLGTRLLLSENPAEVVPGIFREIVLPPVRLVVFGTGPEVDPLRDFTRNLGWICENYPQLTDLPPESLPDRRTAAVIMNHHFGRDLAALQVILPQDYAYVGVLGPKKRWQELVHHLQAELTFDSLWQNKVYGPVGLDLGAETPEEIALSIVAEVQAVMTGREGGFLRNRQKPIHNRS